MTNGLSLSVTRGLQAVRVRGEAGAAARVRTEVYAGRLVVFADAPLAGAEVEVLVSVPALSALLASGGSVVEASGVAAADGFFLAASGGSGVLLAGQSLRVEADLSGGAVVEAGELVAAVARLTASGGSTVELSVTRELAVEASAGSVVRVFGAPVVVERTLTGGATLEIEGARAP